jgi:hypothetical protein
MSGSRTPVCLVQRRALRPDVGEAPRQEIAAGGSSSVAACYGELASRTSSRRWNLRGRNRWGGRPSFFNRWQGGVNSHDCASPQYEPVNVLALIWQWHHRRRRTSERHGIACLELRTYDPQF